MEHISYTERLESVISDFWDIRGQRGVRAGLHLDGVAKLVREIFVEEGFADSSIQRRNRGLTLPGYYRATKDWDLMVVYKGVLAAAIERKSMVGSVGKNVNNRAEEAVGTATDLWAAHREGRYGLVRPWVGYFVLLGDQQDIDDPVSVNEPFFKADEEFQGASYKERWEILCKRLVEKRHYDASCLIVATDNPSKPIRETVPNLNFDQFAAKIRERARALSALREAL
jgi:hypothetical protein